MSDDTDFYIIGFDERIDFGESFDKRFIEITDKYSLKEKGRIN